jgi:hypothetical protein
MSRTLLVSACTLALFVPQTGVRADARPPSLSVLGTWQCDADAPPPSGTIAAVTFLATFDLGSTFVATSVTPGLSQRGLGTWQRTGVRTLASREVVIGNAPRVAFDTTYRRERGGKLSFERVGFLPDQPGPPNQALFPVVTGTCVSTP